MAKPDIMRSKFYFLIVLLFLVSTLEAQNYKFGKVSKEELAETEHPTNKDADAAILYKKQYTYYDYSSSTGFSLITKYHYRIKLYNEEGFDWATQNLISHVSGNDEEKIYSLKAYTYNLQNGEIIEEKLRKDEIFTEEISKYRKAIKFTMPSLKAGSVIEYMYQKSSPFITSLDDTELQARIPIKSLDVKVEIPEFFGFVTHYNQMASLFIPIHEKRESFTMHAQRSKYSQTVYEISKENIPALKEEIYVDYLDNYAARIKWELQYTKFPDSPIKYFSNDWDDVAKSIYDEGGYANELRKSSFFKDDLQALLQDVEKPKDKIFKIYNFIKTKVAWNNYVGFIAENGIRKAYKEGSGNIGDINLLLTAMLKHAGLKANPVLVSTKSNGIPVFPTRSGFNYVIVGVQLDDDQIVLLDASDKNAAPGQLPERARNWQGRMISDDGKSNWVSLLPNYFSLERNFINIQITDDFKVKGDFTGMYNKLVAKKYRDKYKGIDVENYKQLLQEDKGDIIITNIQKENVKEIGKDIKESYQFELKNGVEVIGENIYLNPLLFLAETENPFKAEERIYPVYMDFPLRNSSVINFMLPEGYRFEAMPESAIVKMNENGAVFKFILKTSSNFLRLESTIDIYNSIYTAEDYKHLKNFFDEIVSKHSEAIVLSKIEENNESTELTKGR